MRKLILIIASFLISVSAFSQVSSLSIDDVYESYRDSLKETPYPWHLPILGAKVRKMGFDIPYPNGIMLTYGHSKQSLTLDNLEVGFSSDNLVNVDRVARFHSIDANVDAVIAKYDFWLLPFVNVFGLAGRIQSNTDVILGLPFEMAFQAHSVGTTVGWGTVVAGGVGPLVMTGNFVQTWTFVPSLSSPSRTIVVDGRVGYMLRFKNPERNMVFLVGAQYLGLNPQSSGSADLEKLLGITPEKKQNAAEQLEDWYVDLSDAEKEIFGGLYDGLSGWLNKDEPAKLHYSFSKRLYYPMSMTLGVNFQLNHRFQFNAIYTFLGSREQVVLGFNYRFGWRGKNYLHGVTL